jgi:DNA-binding beta-propeller fold protein YncE
MLIHDEVIPDIEDNPLKWPVGVASASADEIVVAEAYESRLVIFRRKSGVWRVDAQVRLEGTPIGLAWDGTRYAVSMRQRAGLYAVEGMQHALRRIALPKEAIPGALAARPGGGWLVYDFASKAVLQLDVKGAASGRTPVQGRLTALAAAPGGGFFAAFADLAELRRYGADGQVLDRFSVPGQPPVPAWPSGIAVKPGGDLVVADRHNGRLLLFNGAGRLEATGARPGWLPGRLRFPADVALLVDGRIVVVDQGNRRLQLFREIKRSDAP